MDGVLTCRQSQQYRRVFSKRKCVLLAAAGESTARTLFFTSGDNIAQQRSRGRGSDGSGSGSSGSGGGPRL